MKITQSCREFIAYSPKLFLRNSLEICGNIFKYWKKKISSCHVECRFDHHEKNFAQKFYKHSRDMENKISKISSWQKKFNSESAAGQVECTFLSKNLCQKSEIFAL